MLRDTFFRVQSYHPYVPLEGSWYAFENDNIFQILKGSDVKTTYSSPSKSMGLTKSAFNTEYCVYENGAGQIKTVDENGDVFTLLTVTDLVSLVCFNKSFCVTSFNTITKIATAKFYIIVGTPTAPFVQLLTTKTLTLPANIFPNVNCKADVTTAFVGQYVVTGPLYYSLKITKPDTFTNDESDPLNDATFEIIDGSLESQGVPATDAIIPIVNTSNRFYNPNLDYYMTQSGSLFTLKNLAGDTITTISGTNVRVFIDNDGDGYITITGIKTISGSSRLFSQIYSLISGVKTLIQEVDAGANSGNTYNFSSGSGLFPLIQDKIPPILAVRSTIIYGFSYTTSGAVFTNYTGTGKALSTFGSKVLWI